MGDIVAPTPPWPCWLVRLRLPHLADRSIDDSVEQLSVVGTGLRLDVLPRTFARLGVIRQRQPTSLRRDLRQLLNDVEERGLILSRKLPAVRDRTRKNLLRGPVMRSGGVGRGRNGHRRGRLLSRRGKCCGGESEANDEAISPAHESREDHKSRSFACGSYKGLVVVVVIVIPVILGSLAHDSPDARTRRTTDQRALHAATEDRSQRRTASPANQRAFARADAALILVMVVIVVVAMIIVVVVVPAPTAAAHAFVVGAVVVVMLSVCRRETGNEQQRS
jgi:hypothetical protein